MRAPHIRFDVLGRTNRRVTQMYFAGEPLNETDRFLASAAKHRDRLIVTFMASTGREKAGWLPGHRARLAVVCPMLFAKPLRHRIRSGRIRCTIRVWTRPHVKVGGRYRMDEGHVVVDSITPITVDEVTHDLARESGFESVEELLRIARHGRGEHVYLIRFHYLPPGAWDTPGGVRR